MANTDLHNKKINEVQSKDNEAYFSVRTFSTERTFPNPQEAEPLTEGQDFPPSHPM